jgi:hypothetical protein
LILLETIQDSFALTRSPSLSAAAPTLPLFLLAAARPRTLARLTMPARGQGFVLSARPTAAGRFSALFRGALSTPALWKNCQFLDFVGKKRENPLKKIPPKNNS